MTSSLGGHSTSPRFARGNASLTVLILNGTAVEVDAQTVTTEQARAAVEDYFGVPAEVVSLQTKLRRAFELLHEVRPIIGSDALHDRVEGFLTGADHEYPLEDGR